MQHVTALNVFTSNFVEVINQQFFKNIYDKYKISYTSQTFVNPVNVSSNALYIEQSVDSLSKADNLNTYCGSPKLDYCSQYELKVEEETDPDIIPCHYGEILRLYNWKRLYKRINTNEKE